MKLGNQLYKIIHPTRGMEWKKDQQENFNLHLVYNRIVIGNRKDLSILLMWINSF